MENYDLYLPTHLIFGRGRIDELPSLLPAKGSRILLAMGGGSIRRISLYDKLRELLSDYEVFDFSGIEPNPKISTIRRAVDLCKAQKIDFIVAAGGGSVIDAVKCIAAGAYYDGDPWDLVLDHSRIGRAIPFCAVLTLSATGSDYDNSGVISNSATNEKMFLAASNLFPQASILDPTYTFTVPANQTAAGSADIISHTFEQYLVKEGNPFTDAMCEGVLRTVFEYAPKAIAAPDDYEARAQLMMVSSFGCCGLLSIGRTPSPWPCHGMEHEISAFYDITHGVGLAILTPNWMRWSLTPETAPRFAQYGVRVWHLNPQDDVMTNAQKAIEKTGVPIKSTDIDKYASASRFTLIPDATKLQGYDVAVKIAISNITIDTELKTSDFKYDLKCNDGSSTTTIKSGTGADFTSTELEIGTLSTQNSTFNVSKTYNCALRLWLQETGSNQNALMNKSFSGLIKVNSVYRK